MISILKSESKMKSWIIFILVFTSTALISNAQYLRAVKGDKVPYDSAVITSLSTYRLESKKFRAAENLISGLKVENDSLRSQIVVKAKIDSAQSNSLKLLEQSAKRNEQAFTDLSGKFDKLYSETTKRKKWFEKPIPFVLLGAAAGYLLAR
jgi:hypothetical protein